MGLIPPTLMELAGSKKAVTFWVIVALWMPVIYTTIGLTEHSLMWITVAFCAYVLGQGLADYGLAMAGKKKE